MVTKNDLLHNHHLRIPIIRTWFFQYSLFVKERQTAPYALHVHYSVGTMTLLAEWKRLQQFQHLGWNCMNLAKSWKAEQSRRACSSHYYSSRFGLIDSQRFLRYYNSMCNYHFLDSHCNFYCLYYYY